MLTEQRHEIILNILNEKGSITVSELKEMLDISESTARRDLTELDRDKKLVKVFGGAVALDNSVITGELSFSQKTQVNVEEKKIIAKYAASLIEPGDFVYLDAGTSTEFMIDYINCREATYVTNAVLHARRLAEKGLKVIIIGGELKQTTEAVVGAQAILDMERYNFTKGFFGTNGVSRSNGFTTPDNAEAHGKSVAISRCRSRFILADNDKFGKTSAVKFANFEDATVITDTEPTGHYQNCENIISVSK